MEVGGVWGGRGGWEAREAPGKKKKNFSFHFLFFFFFYLFFFEISRGIGKAGVKKKFLFSVEIFFFFNRKLALEVQVVEEDMEKREARDK